MPDPRRPLISGNWKMNLNHFEAIQAVQKLHWLLPKDVYETVDVSVHPPFTDVRSVQTVIQGDSMELILGAQHCHHDDSGAFTGEISPAFLAKLDVKMVIVGHSERRQLFGEDDAMVNTKVRAILKHSMTPILCVGETLAEREAGETEIRVLSQLSAGLDGVKAEQAAAMVIAYEPVWAIGTGRTATAADAQAVCLAIRSAIAARFDAATAAAVRIQYGGSVKAGTIEELMACPDIDGALVGGASLDPDEFAQIIRLAAS
jgi:triosephosphate isomerase